ncbi:aldo/keto reductase family protein [Ceratobasidium sp. AG-Ba]|nr:aldo/keto reductase family protein [Ceratobasidium sp. AG-Ba]
MSYGSPEWQGWVLGEEEGIKHIKAAYDLGIQTFDTANVYSNGASEIIWEKQSSNINSHDEIVVMTKHIFESVKHSLERLQLDYVVLQCHRFDPDTPIAETMHALHDVVKAGYARYLGMSSCYAYQFQAMQNYAIANNLTPFISMQNHYSLVYREEEREMMPTLKMFGVGSIPWSPLGRGFLTRPLGQQSSRAQTDVGWWHSQSNEAKSEIVRVALAWCMSRDPVTAPVVGTTSLANLEDLVGAVHIKLTEEEVKQLDEPYVPQAVIGHF